MPQSTMNGHTETKVMNGHGSASTGKSIMSGYEMCDGNFLFTSESVGEGHPGKCSHMQTQFLITIFSCLSSKKEETKKKTQTKNIDTIFKTKKKNNCVVLCTRSFSSVSSRQTRCGVYSNKTTKKKKDFINENMLNRRASYK